MKYCLPHNKHGMKVITQHEYILKQSDLIFIIILTFLTRKEGWPKIIGTMPLYIWMDVGKCMVHSMQLGSSI